MTTALTAVGTLASGAALAAEKPKVSIGGYYDLYFGISDQDEASTATTGTPVYDSGSAVNRFGIVHYGEVHITARGTTDSGLKWRVRFEDVQDDRDIGVYTSPSQTAKKVSTDEAWVELTGSWGRLIMGGQDGPGDTWEGGADLVYTGARDHSIFADLNQGLVSGADKTNMEDSSDATKVYYSTPRIAGFRANYSYSPEGEATGSVNRNAGDAGEGGPFHEASVEYRGKVGNDVMLRLNLKGARYELPDAATGADDTNNVWGLSGNVTFGAFTVAAGYVDNGEKDGTDSSSAWDAGVAFNGGKWEASLSYLKSTAEEVGTGLEDEYDQWVVSGVYNLGGGMTVAASLYFFNVDVSSATAAGDGELDTEGWAGVVKTSFRF
ncbi:MAG: porin [Alphaproteobacteria bacterium]